MKKEYQATNYESDLTDKQWEAIKEFFPSGNKSKYHKRSLVEAVLYIVKTGCQWRMLPHDYPSHDTVWSFYRRARENGVWDKMMKHLVKITRKQAGRNEEPSYALIDSQSVKTTCYGENHGYDVEKNEGKKTAHCNRYDGKSPVYSTFMRQIFTIQRAAYTRLKKHFIGIRPFRRDVQMAVIEEHSGILLMNFTISELIFPCK